jgi:2-iminobutanoate/2-iminopropanoate deaminase
MPKIIFSEKAPAVIGPYSQAVLSDRSGLIFTAGQLGVIPGSGELAAGGIEAQTRQALENIRAVVETAHSDLGHVIKTTVFLKNMDDFPVMNKVYSEYFPLHPPSRSTIEVARLPKNAAVEIEVIAQIKSESDE